MDKGGNILVGDVGGTRVRFAWADSLSSAQVFPASQFRSFDDALRHFMATQDRKAAAAIFSVAGIIHDGGAEMTNLDWRMDEGALARLLGAKRVQLVNDFTAAALGIPHLKENEMAKIGGGDPRDDAPKAILGPGTGLGVGGLVPDGRGGFIPLYGEGGHADLPAANARELAVLGALLRGHGHVSAERVLSGEGMENLYRVLAVLDGAKAKPLAAPEIDAAARAGNDARATETIALFTGWLGAVAGNVALTLGARGGVYLAGGILPRWGKLFDAKLFRARFEAKGRMRVFLEPIPVFLITADEFALRGLAALARAP